VESHGKNPQNEVVAIIPARYESSRLPGKLLLSLGGKPLILHTLDRAMAAGNVSRVIVATDDERICDLVRSTGGEAVMTAKTHNSGSDRLAEVAASLPERTVIVNVQGDEPLISPYTIESAVEALQNDGSVDIATTSESIENYLDVLNPNVVKVVSDANGFALYFSRSPIPYPRAAVIKHGTLENALSSQPELLSLFRKHTGLYVYRREFLLKYSKLPQSSLEKTESLEQLRALAIGARIKVVSVSEHSIGVDTPEDFERVQSIVETSEITFREATEGDIPAISRIQIDSWKRSFASLVPQEFLETMSVEKRVEAFKQRFAEGGFYKMFVAEDANNGIVGFADIGQPRSEHKFDAELYAIYFLPEFQRRGIGTRLFRLCQRTIVEHGCNSMCLDTLEVNPYRKFYDKLGGKVVASGSHKLAGVEFKTLIYGWSDIN
jgi:3-deoxy-manno-octulosonate cytidylyltransferase (CMP-KDO synthetase)